MVSGRITSSRVASPQPSSVRMATGTRSCWILPASYAAAVFCWLARAKRSLRSLVSCGKRSWMRSAVAPMTRASSPTRRSLRKRGLGSTPEPIGWWPMCSTPPAMATSYMPKPIEPDIIAAAVMAPAHMRSIAKPGTVFGQAGEDRGRAPEREALVAGLGGGRDRDVVDAVLRHVRIAFEQSDDRLDDEVVGSRVPVHALFTGSPNGVRTPSTNTTSARSATLQLPFDQDVFDPTNAIRGR